MLNESFKCFFAFTGLDLGPIGLALLAHIYGKVAICKSCENLSRHTSNFRRSPRKQRFRSSTTRTLRRGMVTVPGWAPAGISTSVRSGRSRFLVPRSPIKYPHVCCLRLLSGTRSRSNVISSEMIPAPVDVYRGPTTSDWSSHGRRGCLA